MKIEIIMYSIISYSVDMKAINLEIRLIIQLSLVQVMKVCMHRMIVQLWLSKSHMIVLLCFNNSHMIKIILVLIIISRLIMSMTDIKTLKCHTNIHLFLQNNQLQWKLKACHQSCQKVPKFLCWQSLKSLIIIKYHEKKSIIIIWINICLETLIYCNKSWEMKWNNKIKSWYQKLIKNTYH